MSFLLMSLKQFVPSCPFSGSLDGSLFMADHAEQSMLFEGRIPFRLTDDVNMSVDLVSSERIKVLFFLYLYCMYICVLLMLLYCYR